MEQRQEQEGDCIIAVPLEQGQQEETSQEIANRIEALLTTEEFEARKRKIRNRRTLIICFGLFMAASLAREGYLIGNMLKWWGKMPDSWQAFLTAFSVLILVSIFVQRYISQSHKNTVDALAELDDVRAIGPLVSSLEWIEHANRTAVVAKLIQLLPRLQPADAGILNANQRAILYRTLDKKYLLPDGVSDRLADFQIAVLKALEQIDDGKALPHVETLADSSALSPREREVCTLAQSCLSVLRQRAEQMQAESELLRASDSPISTSEELLRAARQISDITSDQLLRGSAQEEES